MHEHDATGATRGAQAHTRDTGTQRGEAGSATQSAAAPPSDRPAGGAPAGVNSGGEGAPRHLWVLTRHDVDYVLHYTHWIPIGRGYTRSMLARHYPGWTLGTLVGLFDRAGIRILPADLQGARGAQHGGRCHWQVVSISFSSPVDVEVEWDRSLPFD
ncbi:MAG: hypothetical protein RLZZ432_512, partial [Chloroflexota bacterium]